jgi:hypothetical protein
VEVERQSEAVGRPQLDGIRPSEPGEGYLILQPSDRGSFTVALGWGPYSAESFSIEGRERILGEETTVESPAGRSFSAPSEASGPAVLYLRKVGR